MHPLRQAGPDAGALGIVAKIVDRALDHLLGEIGGAQVQVEVDALQRDRLGGKARAQKGTAFDDGRAGHDLRIAGEFADDAVGVGDAGIEFAAPLAGHHERLRRLGIEDMGVLLLEAVGDGRGCPRSRARC